MAVITPTKNKVHFGLEGLTFWFPDPAGDYGQAIHVPGVVGFSASPQQKSDKFHADNCVYFIASADGGDEGELETAGLPDEVLCKMLGWRTDKNGALVRVANGKPSPFAMAFRVAGDAADRGKVYYNGMASIPEDANQTKADSVDVQTEKLTINFTPKEIGKEMVVSCRVDADAAPDAWKTFFTTVYMPDAVVAAG